MASRISRQLFSSSLRVSARSNAFRASSRRSMSSAAEPKKGSDMPWIIGSAVVFGPAFLYMLSPSARKTAPHKPHDKHESKSHVSLPMKDDEGTVADVSESVQKAEAADAPQSSSAEPAKEEEVAPAEETKTEPEPAPAETKDEPAATSDGETTDEKADEKTEKSDS